MTRCPDYYNEWDGFCADWLCNLMEAGLIPAGDVDRRSIRDVQPSDLIGYRQCHFFAGIGGYPLALQLAGFPDDLDVWTGSCPCQPFSAAGKRKGTADGRHLWPEFHRLIAARNPAVVFGEQVASKDGRLWLAGVRADLEALGYAVGGADLCAAGCGAPEVRQRLYWVADTRCAERPGRGDKQPATGPSQGCEGPHNKPRGHSAAGRMADPDGGLARHGNLQRGREYRFVAEDGCVGRLEHATSDGWIEWRPEPSWWSPVGRCSAIISTDGKARRVEPGTFPLAHGVPARVGQLRAYGNAIVPQVAAEFIGAWLDCQP